MDEAVAIDRTCNTCAAPVHPRNRTGRCAKCAASDPGVRARKGQLTPEQRERRAAAARALSADPVIVARRAVASRAKLLLPHVKARHKAACKRAAAARMADPVQAERLREIGRTYGAANWHLSHTPEVRARAAAKTKAHHLAWCPEEHWPLNQTLKRKGYRLPDRMRMIDEEIAAAAASVRQVEARRLAAMTPFERQMEAVRNGARVINKPTFHRPDAAYSLVGNATAML